MIKEIQIRITLEEERIEDILLQKTKQKLGALADGITGIKVLRKSIDARKPLIIFNYKVAVYINEALPEASEY